MLWVGCWVSAAPHFQASVLALVAAPSLVPLPSLAGPFERMSRVYHIAGLQV